MEDDDGFVVVHPAEVKTNDTVVAITHEELWRSFEKLFGEELSRQPTTDQFIACVSDVLSTSSLEKCNEIDFRAIKGRYDVLDDDCMTLAEVCSNIAVASQQHQKLLLKFQEVFQGLPYVQDKPQTAGKKKKAKKTTSPAPTTVNCIDAVSGLLSSEDGEEDTDSPSQYDYYIQRKNSLHAHVTYSCILLFHKLMPSISTLRLDGYPVCQRTLCLLLTPTTFPSLERLSLASSPCLDFFDSLAGVAHPTLQELNLSGWSNRDHVEDQSLRECNLLAIVAACPKLQRLRLSDSWARISHRLLEQLSKHCHDFRKLTMTINLEGDDDGNLALTQQSIEALVSGCPRLSSLNACASGIADKAVAVLLQCPQLKRLHLFGGGGDTLDGKKKKRQGRRGKTESAPSVAVLQPPNPSTAQAPCGLEYLFLSGPDLVSATLIRQHLLPLLAHAPKLRVLNLQWDSEAHAEASVALAELLQSSHLVGLETICFPPSPVVDSAVFKALREKKLPALRVLKHCGRSTGDEQRNGPSEVVTDGSTLLPDELVGIQSELTELHLSGLLLTAQLFERIAGAFPSLTSLYLNSYSLPEATKSNAEGVFTAFLKSFPNLRLLSLPQTNSFDWFSVPLLRAFHDEALKHRVFPTQLTLPEHLKIQPELKPSQNTPMVHLLDELQEGIVDRCTMQGGDSHFQKFVCAGLSQFVQQGTLPQWLLKDCEEQKGDQVEDMGEDSDEENISTDASRPIIQQYHSLIRQLRRSSKKLTSLNIPGLLPSIINPYLHGAAPALSFIVDQNVLKTVCDALENNRAVSELVIRPPNVGFGDPEAQARTLAHILPVMPRIAEVLGTLSALTTLKITQFQPDVVAPLLSRVQSPVLSVVEVQPFAMKDSIVLAISSLITNHAKTLTSVTFGPPQNTYESQWGSEAIQALHNALRTLTSPLCTINYSAQTLKPATFCALVKDLVVTARVFLGIHPPNEQKFETNEVFVLLDAFIANEGRLGFGFRMLNIIGEHVYYGFQSLDRKLSDAALILAQVKARGLLNAKRDLMAQVFITHDPVSSALDMYYCTGNMDKAVEAFSRASTVMIQAVAAARQAAHPTWRSFYPAKLAPGELFFIEASHMDDEIVAANQLLPSNPPSPGTQAELVQILAPSPTDTCVFVGSQCSRRSWFLPSPGLHWLNEADIAFGAHADPIYVGEMKAIPSDRVALAHLYHSRPDITPQMMETVTPDQIRAQCGRGPSFLLGFGLTSPPANELCLRESCLIDDGGSAVLLKFLEEKERGEPRSNIVLPQPKQFVAAYQVRLADTTPSARVVWVDNKRLIFANTLLNPLFSVALPSMFTSIIVIKGVAVVMAGNSIMVFKVEEGERSGMKEVNAFATLAIKGKPWSMGWCGDSSIFYGLKNEVVELVWEGTSLKQKATLSVANKREMDKPTVMSIASSPRFVVAATLGTVQIFARDNNQRTSLLQETGVSRVSIWGEHVVFLSNRPRTTPKRMRWHGTGEPVVKIVNMSTGSNVATIIGCESMSGFIWDQPHNKVLVAGSRSLLEITMKSTGGEQKTDVAVEEQKWKSVTSSTEMEALRARIQDILGKGKKKPGQRLEAISTLVAEAPASARTELFTFAFMTACEYQMEQVGQQLCTQPLDYTLQVPPFGSSFHRPTDTRWSRELKKELSFDPALSGTVVGASFKVPTIAVAVLDLPSCPPISWDLFYHATTELSTANLMTFDQSAETLEAIDEYDTFFCRLLKKLQPPAIQLSVHSLTTLADQFQFYHLSKAASEVNSLIVLKSTLQSNPHLRTYETLKRAVENVLKLSGDNDEDDEGGVRIGGRATAALAEVQSLLDKGADPDGHAKLAYEEPDLVSEMGAQEYEHQSKQLVHDRVKQSVWRDFPPTLLCLACREQGPEQGDASEAVALRGQLITMLLKAGADPNRPGLLPNAPRVELPIDLLFSPTLIRLFVTTVVSLNKQLDLSQSSILIRLAGGNWVGCCMKSNDASWDPTAQRVELTELLLEQKADVSKAVNGFVPLEYIRKEAQAAAERVQNLPPAQAGVLGHFARSLAGMERLCTSAQSLVERSRALSIS